MKNYNIKSKTRKIEDIIKEYRDLGITETIDHDKFNAISIVHHSTVLEGSTLTEIETSVLINDNLTPKGKPLEHSLMVKDHFNALKFVIEQADKKTTLSVALIQQMAGLILKHTGSVYQTIFGTVDARKGQFRKGNVSAGGTYFPSYDKVEKLTNELVKNTNEKMSGNLSLEEKLNLSFDAHFNLVSIHPFYDGNGRTSRLLMNYIQHWYAIPLSIVRSESKQNYIKALIETTNKKDLTIFRNFMKSEYILLLEKEIKKYKDIIKPKKGRGFSLMF